MKTWNEEIEELAEFMVSKFHENNLVFMDLLSNADCTRKILVWIYNRFVYQKKIIKIEDRPQENRIKLWEASKEFAEGRLKKDGLIELSKALYTLEYLLNQ